MKEKQENDVQRRPSTWKRTAIAAAIVSTIQACLTIEGRGVEGFVLWVLILFVGYWLLFTFLAWVWRRFMRR